MELGSIAKSKPIIFKILTILNLPYYFLSHLDLRALFSSILFSIRHTSDSIQKGTFE